MTSYDAVKKAIEHIAEARKLIGQLQFSDDFVHMMVSKNLENSERMLQLVEEKSRPNRQGHTIIHGMELEGDDS